MAKYLTPERIAAKAERFDGLANIREINRLFRAQDESHLWPVSNRFDATERAIRRVRRLIRGGDAVYGLEYALAIDAELSRIVNSI